MTQFWKQKPKAPLDDWRTYLIGVPVLASALGACLFMALSFSFTELEAIPAHVKIGLVIVAAFATATGSAFGSVGSGIEVYRKAFEGRAIWLDWVSLALSVAATLGGFVMGFAALLGAVSEWSAVARVWGPLAISALVALDAAGDLIELGGLFAAYNLRYEQWEQDKAEWEQAHGIVEPIDRSSWPAATKDDARRLATRLNGERADVTAGNLQTYLDTLQVRADVSESTRARWADVIRNGG